MMFTSEDITANSTIILILLGISFLMEDNKKLLKATTKVNDSPITKLSSSLTVTAKAEHTPNTWKAIGLLTQMLL